MFTFLRDNQAVKMEKDEDINDHYSHTGITWWRQNFVKIFVRAKQIFST